LWTGVVFGLVVDAIKGGQRECESGATTLLVGGSADCGPRLCRLVRGCRQRGVARVWTGVYSTCSRVPSRGVSAIESLVPRCYALGAVSFVDRGCVDLFADAVKWGAMLVGVWCHDALGAVSVVDPG